LLIVVCFPAIAVPAGVSPRLQHSGGGGCRGHSHRRCAANALPATAAIAALPPLPLLTSSSLLLSSLPFLLPLLPLLLVDC
jgi:hypothetical protein